MNTDAWGREGTRACHWCSSCLTSLLWMSKFPSYPTALPSKPLSLQSSQPSNSTASFPLFLSTRQPQGHAPVPSAPMSRTNDSTPVISAAWVRPSYEGTASSWLRGSFVQKEAQAGCETVLKRISSSRCQAHQPWQVEDERDARRLFQRCNPSSGSYSRACAEQECCPHPTSTPRLSSPLLGALHLPHREPPSLPPTPPLH